MTLNNVELRTEVLQDELDTSLTFKRIFIQELKLNIPWASLRYQPAKVLMPATSCARAHAVQLRALAPSKPTIAALLAHRFECATPKSYLWPAVMSLLLPAPRKMGPRRSPSRTTLIKL